MMSHGVEIYSLLLEDSSDCESRVDVCFLLLVGPIGGLSHEYEVMGSGPGVPVSEPTFHTHGDSFVVMKVTNIIRSLDLA